MACEETAPGQMSSKLKVHLNHLEDVFFFVTFTFISPDYKISGCKSFFERTKKHKGTEKYLFCLQLLIVIILSYSLLTVFFFFFWHWLFNCLIKQTQKQVFWVYISIHFVFIKFLANISKSQFIPLVNSWLFYYNSHFLFILLPLESSVLKLWY